LRYNRNRPRIQRASGWLRLGTWRIIIAITSKYGKPYPRLGLFQHFVTPTFTCKKNQGQRTLNGLYIVSCGDF
jgi:hypothetical protein